MSNGIESAHERFLMASTSILSMARGCKELTLDLQFPYVSFVLDLQRGTVERTEAFHLGILGFCGHMSRPVICLYILWRSLVEELKLPLAALEGSFAC